MHLGTPGESGGRWRQPCALRLPGPLTSAQHRVHVTAAAAGPLAVPHPWCLTAPVPCRPDKSASTCCATSSAGEESSPLRLQQHQHAAGDGRRLAPGAGVAGHGCTAAGAMRCAEHKKAGMSGCTLCQHVCLSSSSCDTSPADPLHCSYGLEAHDQAGEASPSRPRAPATPALQQQDQRPPRMCAAEGCGATRGLRSCGGCHVVRYCSEACSRAHWRAHKAECRHLQAAGAAEASSSQHG